MYWPSNEHTTIPYSCPDWVSQMAHKSNTVGYHHLLSDWKYVLKPVVPAYATVSCSATYPILNIYNYEHIHINYVTMQKVNKLFVIGSWSIVKDVSLQSNNDLWFHHWYINFIKMCELLMFIRASFIASISWRECTGSKFFMSHWECFMGYGFQGICKCFVSYEQCDYSKNVTII